MRKVAFFIAAFAFSAQAWCAGVPWVHSFQTALADAKRDSKPIFVDIYADWCTWCAKLDRDVYSTPQFVKYMQNFIPVRLNAEDNKEGTDFANQYNVDGFPTLIVTDSSGAVTNRIGGYMDANALIKDMEGIQSLVKREKDRPDDLQTSFHLAHEYLEREMYAEAEKRFLRVVGSPKGTATEKEASQFSLALAQYYQHKLEPALDSLNQYRTSYPHGSSEEDALLLLSQIYIETDTNAKARDVLQQFLKDFPDSSNADRAREVLDLLDKGQK